jgi:hypothetical protein
MEPPALGTSAWWLQRLYRDELFSLGVAPRSHRTGDVKPFLPTDYDTRRWIFESLPLDEPPKMHVVILDDLVCRVDYVEVIAQSLEDE